MPPRSARRASGGPVALAAFAPLVALLALAPTVTPAPLAAQAPASGRPAPDRLPPSPPATPARPAVHLVATGGTISNLGGDGRLTGAQLVAGLPQLAESATLTVEQFANVASTELTGRDWLALSRRVRAVLRERPDLRGVVVTHGTDTLEETAWWLDLTVGDCRPVVVTGAMRNPRLVAPDGPGNLLDAVRVAASPAAVGRGALVVLNDHAFAARDVTKSHTLRLDTFVAPVTGALAVADEDSVVFTAPPARETGRGCGAPRFDVDAVTALPRVDVVVAHVDADGALIDAAVAAGARGLVLAGAGAGGGTPGQAQAIERALARGVVVMASSRTGSGRVAFGRSRGAEPAAGRGVRFGAEDLNPWKARVLLQLALATQPDPAAVRRAVQAALAR